MKTTPSSTRRDEIAAKLAEKLCQLHDSGGSSEFYWAQVRDAERMIAAAYAPLYEQKEELVRVLRGFWDVLEHGLYDDNLQCLGCGLKRGHRESCAIAKAESALEKAGGGK